MSKIGRFIIGVNYFSLGIMVPIFNLLLLDRGATLKTLPLLLAVYSCTVLLIELPSGICADLFGRKNVFLLSCVFQILSFLPLFWHTNMSALVFAVIMSGFGRAFSSGSLDALIIDQALEKNGEGVLSKVTSSLAVIQGLGLSIGGIAGGFVAARETSYNSNILLRLALTLCVFGLCCLFVKEKKSDTLKVKRNSFLTGFKGKYIGGNKFRLSYLLWLVLAGTFFTGIFLSFTETYWQSAFKEISGKGNGTWRLGFISFLGFAADTGGTILIGKLLGKAKNGWWRVFYIGRLTFAVVIFLFAIQKNNTGFILGYFLVYFVLGMSSVTESTIINKLIPSHLRSSFLSLSSLVLQIGCLFASILSSIFITRLHFSGLWILSGILIVGYTLIVIFVSWVKELRINSRNFECLYKEDTMNEGNYELKSITPDNREKINQLILSQWFGMDMIIRGEIVDLTKIDGYAAYEGEKIVGLITYRIQGEECEITSLDSFKEGAGIGSNLIEEVAKTAKLEGCRSLKLITTNDNINALRFYQKRGFDMTNLYYNAIEASRKLKPSIPMLGDYNIPIRHEIEFKMSL